MNLKSILIATAAVGSLTAMTACARAPDPSAGDAAVAAASSTPVTAAEATGSAAPPPVAQALVAADANAPRMIVHKTPTCGCCGLWVDHMRAAGFVVDVRNADDISPVKERLGVPYGKGSCHTAEVAGYFVEGHVPAEDVKRLIAEKPDAKGLALPGMPMGSPGMESPDGRVQPYTVELVGRDGAVTAFADHAGDALSP